MNMEATESLGKNNVSAATDKKRKKNFSITSLLKKASFGGRDSLTNHLPYADINSNNTVALIDERSNGAVFGITPISAEGATREKKVEINSLISDTLSSIIPERIDSPWMLSFYTRSEDNLMEFAESLADYEEIKDDPFNIELQAHYERHYKRIARPKGLFEDPAQGNQPWRGMIRQVRMVLHRHVPRGQPNNENEVDDLARKIELALQDIGIAAKRFNGEQTYNWLVNTFNRSPARSGGDSHEFLKMVPYPGDGNLPMGRDFSELLCLSQPQVENGVFKLDGGRTYSKIVSTLGMRKPPNPGHLTSEQSHGKSSITILDRLPEGTTVVQTIYYTPQDKIESHIRAIKSASIGDQRGAAITAEQAEYALDAMARNMKMYPMSTSFYFEAPSLDELDRKIQTGAAILTSQGYDVIDGDSDPFLTHKWIDTLPMCCSADKLDFYCRSPLTYMTHIAATLPLVGRPRGTGHPGIIAFNRGAEPFTFDPLNKKDRKQNGHLLLLGPTGSGKSAKLCDMIFSMSKAHRPRWFIVEAGNSLGLTVDMMERFGYSVHRVSAKPGNDISLPPFSDALNVLVQQEENAQDNVVSIEKKRAEVNEDQSWQESLEDDKRDYLGEAEIMARIMITGGDLKEADRYRPSDKLIVTQAIINAAQYVHDENVKNDTHFIVRPTHVINELQLLGDDHRHSEGRRERIREMADSMAVFTKGFNGYIFDREGTQLPDVDVLIFDLASFARQGYEGQLSLAYTALTFHINNLAENHQYDARQSIMLTDEGHLITKNPLLMQLVMKITKMWRKLGLWYWLATQSLEDFPVEATQVLNMIEWWLCLSMPKSEINQILRFRDLTPDQMSMVQSARKEPGKYTEGVLLVGDEATMFRNVPPPIMLTIPGSEKHEKAERREVAEKYNLATELDAALYLAKELEALELRK